MILSDIMYIDGPYFVIKNKENGFFEIYKDGKMFATRVGEASDFEKAKESVEWHKTMDKPKVKFKWIAYSSDGWSDESEQVFNTKEDCYNDMRRNALLKMEWNTEFSEDFLHQKEIAYSVVFTKDSVVHTSYSGEYVYEIEEVK